MAMFLYLHRARPVRRLLLTVLALMLLTILAACAGNPPLPPPGEDGSITTPSGEGDTGIETRRLDQRGLLGIDEDDRAMFVDPNNPLSTRIIYFGFDSNRIRPRFREAIQAHAGYLADHPDVQLRLEGHTDEKGTREYNVALGERRSQAVKQALVIAGAGANQLSVLSFGEERPAEPGSSTAADERNRRVELIYVP